MNLILFDKNAKVIVNIFILSQQNFFCKNLLQHRSTFNVFVVSPFILFTHQISMNVPSYLTPAKGAWSASTILAGTSAFPRVPRYSSATRTRVPWRKPLLPPPQHGSSLDRGRAHIVAGRCDVLLGSRQMSRTTAEVGTGKAQWSPSQSVKVVQVDMLAADELELRSKNQRPFPETPSIILRVPQCPLTKMHAQSYPMGWPSWDQRCSGSGLGFCWL